MLRYAGVLTGDGTRLLQMKHPGFYSEDLTHAVLTFAREHERELLQEGRPLVSAESPASPAYGWMPSRRHCAIQSVNARSSASASSNPAQVRCAVHSKPGAWTPGLR